MTINITLNKMKITIDNNITSIVNIINEFEKEIHYESNLKVFIYDNNTTDFHSYEFEYLSSSKLSPKQWLLNNILYSITCKETKKNMEHRFDNIIILLDIEYRKYN